ncbi:MAG: hypothetical protein JWN99_1622 [Ilumatobacteraceae bacterium]|nr:hypothetical protein [Ilumatobacteraceae bacterium]
MKRLLTSIALGAFVLAGCGSDSGSSSSGATAAPQSIATDAVSSVAPTTPATEGSTAVPATVAAAPTTAAPAAVPTTVAPTESTNVNEGRAAMGALTAQDLPGWTQQPSEQDDDEGDDSEFTAPECAALQALDNVPGLEDDYDVTLMSPDGKTEVDENVTVGDAADVQNAYDVFADPATAACFTATFQALFAEPGSLPDGVTVTGIEFAQQPLTAGDQAIGYLATITVTGEATGVSAPVGVRIDAVRKADAVALISTISTAGAAPVDAAAIAAVAGTKLAAAG